MLVRTNKSRVTCQYTICICLQVSFYQEFCHWLLNFHEISKALPRVLTTPKNVVTFFSWFFPVMQLRGFPAFFRGTSPWGTKGRDLWSVLFGLSILPPSAAFPSFPLPSPALLAFPFFIVSCSLPETFLSLLLAQTAVTLKLSKQISIDQSISFSRVIHVSSSRPGIVLFRSSSKQFALWVGRH